MRRIVISAGIGIVAAGILALPAVSASAAPSAAVSKSAWPPPHDHQAECNTITDDIYRLEDNNVRLEGQLVQAERGGNGATIRRITDQIDANKAQIDRDIQRSVDANCGSLPGGNGVLRADLNPQPLPPGRVVWPWPVDCHGEHCRV